MHMHANAANGTLTDTPTEHIWATGRLTLVGMGLLLLSVCLARERQQVAGVRQGGACDEMSERERQAKGREAHSTAATCAIMPAEAPMPRL